MQDTETKALTTEEIDAELAALREKRKAQREIEHQRETLLPQLEKRRDRLTALYKRAGVDLVEVDDAIRDVKQGRITTYLVRQPRKAKAPKGGAVA